MGYCNQEDHDMRMCLKGERIRRQQANLQEARKRQAEIRERINAKKENNNKKEAA